MTEEQKSGSDLVEELNALGQQLSAALKAVWESEDSRQLRQEIGDGFVEVGRQVNAAMQSAQESETTQQIGEQVKDAMDRARESDLVAQLEEGLAMGLQDLNKGLERLVKSMEPASPTDEAVQSEAEVEPEA